MEIPHPIKHGNWVAQENYHDPSKAVPRLNNLRYDTERYHKSTGMAEFNPKRSRLLTAEAVWRAGIAPLIHGAELIMHEAVAQKAEEGGSLLIPESEQVSHIDRQLNAYHQYYGNKLRFLRSMGWHAIAGTRRLRSQVVNARDTKMRQITEALLIPHNDYIPLSSSPYFKPKCDILSYLAQITVAVNVTALNVLHPAMLHVGLWPARSGDRKAVLLDRAGQLSWTSSMSASAFEASFPDQGDDELAYPPRTCPFAHDAGAVAVGSVWHNPSLVDGPWKLERYCPGDIALSRERYGTAVSASRMRFESGVHVADQIW